MNANPSLVGSVLMATGLPLGFWSKERRHFRSGDLSIANYNPESASQKGVNSRGRNGRMTMVFGRDDRWAYAENDLCTLALGRGSEIKEELISIDS